MIVAVTAREAGLVGDFLNAFAQTAAKIGHEVTRDLESVITRRDVVFVVWNGRSHRVPGTTFYCEHGWLPRWEYQISSRGINADSHIAPFQWSGKPLDALQQNELESHTRRIREREGDLSSPLAPGLPESFLLVPLQMEWDTNIGRHVPHHLKRMQALVDHVSSFDPPFPVIFKQHPLDAHRGNQHMALVPRRNQDAIRPHQGSNVHGLLKTGQCKGIISLNSNVVHDGLVWGVPAIVLGWNIWPREGPSPFLLGMPERWDEFERFNCSPETTLCRDVYAHFLITNQWTLADAQAESQVAELLRPC